MPTDYHILGEYAKYYTIVFNIIFNKSVLRVIIYNINFIFRYIDDVLSINNSRFAEFIPLIYPPELEVKETTDTASSASFLDLYLEFDASSLFLR
jgi:hypothetical protein